ncbi:MAG: hypothetical protein AB8B91_20825, partial [Rubripirellula sp.]
AIHRQGKRWVAKQELKGLGGIDSPYYTFMDFVSESPVAFEIWRLEPMKAVLFRTTTKWKAIQGMKFPVHMEAWQRLPDGKSKVFEVDIEWRFNEDVPERLFQISNVTSRDALDW